VVARHPRAGRPIEGKIEAVGRSGSGKWDRKKETEGGGLKKNCEAHGRGKVSRRQRREWGTMWREEGGNDRKGRMRKGKSLSAETLQSRRCDAGPRQAVRELEDGPKY